MEFNIINKYFNHQTIARSDVMRGIGDDCAIIAPSPHQQLAITTDTLVLDVHFSNDIAAKDLGYKALAVNLSDLAAMGATPAWAMLALTLPTYDAEWLEAFCNGFFELAEKYHLQLIGGDLTQGPLSITIQAIGTLPSNQALLRSGAKPGDLIYVTGTLGDAGAALSFLKNPKPILKTDSTVLLTKLYRPEPRIEIGKQLLNIAHAAIDISDGLVADLSHILKQSNIGANINIDTLPLSETLKRYFSKKEALHFALTSGDDYELCFTISTDQKESVEKKLSQLNCRYTCIGTTTETKTLTIHDQNGKPYHGSISGYQHF